MIAYLFLQVKAYAHPNIWGFDKNYALLVSEMDVHYGEVSYDFLKFSNLVLNLQENSLIIYTFAMQRTLLRRIVTNFLQSIAL